MTIARGNSPGPWRGSDAAPPRWRSTPSSSFRFYLVGAVFAWNSPLRQRLGDRVAQTLVLHPLPPTGDDPLPKDGTGIVS